MIFTLVLKSITMSSKLKWMITGSIFIVLLFIFLIPQKQLVIDPEAGEGLYLPAERFEIHWIHSIEKEEWFEVYDIEDEGFVLSESHSDYVGVGFVNLLRHGGFFIRISAEKTDKVQ